MRLTNMSCVCLVSNAHLMETKWIPLSLNNLTTIVLKAWRTHSTPFFSVIYYGANPQFSHSWKIYLLAETILVSKNITSTWNNKNHYQKILLLSFPKTEIWRFGAKNSVHDPSHHGEEKPSHGAQEKGRSENHGRGWQLGPLYATHDWYWVRW